MTMTIGLIEFPKGAGITYRRREHGPKGHQSRRVCGVVRRGRPRPKYPVPYRAHHVVQHTEPRIPAVKRHICCPTAGQPHPNFVLREAGRSALQPPEEKNSSSRGMHGHLYPERLEIGRCRYRKSIREIDKPPYTKFCKCCKHCRRLQDVAKLNKFRNVSQGASRPTPLNSPSSVLPKTPKSQFSIFFAATLQNPCNRCNSRYNST